ncbi:uncharacterized protein BJ212DRAFT_1294606 [Suillus subaureus]|uniref:Uncharacterized protein n=1 Tax=Suillus subaureus TaxID=48587 RepID=A0A9P7EPU7_9AGAM|nr:uncharacterized protein BJ212DRAFT_1294606 [Suillus subaureus]KAG1827297.1 hypothetical protein BJ212DRAFT_1294606 [Suillus subaureus]
MSHFQLEVTSQNIRDEKKPAPMNVISGLPVIVGSDSEHDGSDQLLSDMDSSAVNKLDNELTSSLMELDLTNVEVKDSDPKGKMKVRSLKSTNHMKSVLSPNQSLSDMKLGKPKFSIPLVNPACSIQ